MHPITSQRINEVRSEELRTAAAYERRTSGPRSPGPVRRWLADAAAATAKRLDPAIRDCLDRRTTTGAPAAA